MTFSCLRVRELFRCIPMRRDPCWKSLGWLSISFCRNQRTWTDSRLSISLVRFRVLIGTLGNLRCFEDCKRVLCVVCWPVAHGCLTNSEQRYPVWKLSSKSVDHWPLTMDSVDLSVFRLFGELWTLGKSSVRPFACEGHQNWNAAHQWRKSTRRTVLQWKINVRLLCPPTFATRICGTSLHSRDLSKIHRSVES